MNQTETHTQLDHLIDGSKEQERRRRNGAITIAVAAVAIVAAVVAWWPGVYQPDAVPNPAEPVVKLNASEQLATDFVAAYAAFDRDLMASYLADDVRVTFSAGYDKESLLVFNRFVEAIDVRMHLERCFQTQALQPDGAQVGCLFSYHAQGSQDLGRGPYGDNTFDITIQNGAITRVSASMPDAMNGWTKEMGEPFNKWLAQAHPDNAAMDAWSDPDSTPTEVNQSLALWKRYVAEYVAAVKAGEAE